MGRPSISLSVIAKDERNNIDRWYESVKDCFDEIHFTDTGSTDGTAERAKELGLTVHHFDWINDFSAARNFAFSKVKTDYAAWIDLDDVLENKDGFLRWRDDVMHLADYWLATYHYTSNPEGKPLCSFLRERVIRTDKGFKWDYPIHEGIKPISPYGDIRANVTNAWCVRHMRTEEDLKKDRSRNLNIFRQIEKEGRLDPRMHYYYGKELFECGQAKESIQYFSKALTDEKLEMHDRILGYQYCCYAFIQDGQIEKAIQLANQGVQLSPHRAELHALIGDAYIKQGNLWGAIPHYAAASNCDMGAPTSYGPAIFKTEAMYTHYPLAQLARIYANLGNIEKAKAIATECYNKYKDNDSKVVLAEINNITRFSDFSNAKQCEDITITCPPQSPYEWDPGIMKEKAMGGSETAAIQMAKWLHKLSGRPVKVFNMRSEDKTFDGVEYLSTNKVAEYFHKNKPYLNINWRHATKVTNAPTYVWSHDLMTMGVENTQNYEKVMCLTPFHKRYMMATQNVPENKIYVTRNGVDPEFFSFLEPVEKDPNMFIFSSSPDRGLDRAMRVLDKVRVVHPDIKLHIFYGIEHLPRFGHQKLHDTLRAMIEERKDWVIYHGATEQKKMYQEFMKAAYCVQPSDWIETSMISAIERVCCGVYQIIRKVGGLVDTLADAEAKGMATLVDSECITEREHQVYVDAVLNAMSENKYKCVKMDPMEWNWEGVAKKWLEDLPNAYYGKSC